MVTVRYEKRNNLQEENMGKMNMVYELTYPDGFKRNTNVRGDIPIDTLNKVLDAWKNLNIKPNLVAIENN